MEKCLLEVKNTNAGARQTVVTLGSAGMLQVIRIFCDRPLIEILLGRRKLTDGEKEKVSEAADNFVLVLLHCFGKKKDSTVHWY